MPLPRYHKLSRKRKNEIIKAAMTEFSRHPFQEASINRIIDNLETSKGTMYYYFSDKADLYSEVVEQWTTEMLKDWQFDLSVKTPDDFWLEWKRLYHTAYEHYEKHPESGVFLRQFLRFMSSGTAPEIVRKHMDSTRAFCLRCLTLGKEIGAIRKDLPESLLVRLFISLYETFDRWVHVTYPELNPEIIGWLADMITDLMKQLLGPQKL